MANKILNSWQVVKGISYAIGIIIIVGGFLYSWHMESEVKGKYPEHFNSTLEPTDGQVDPDGNAEYSYTDVDQEKLSIREELMKWSSYVRYFSIFMGILIPYALIKSIERKWDRLNGDPKFALEDFFISNGPTRLIIGSVIFGITVSIGGFFFIEWLKVSIIETYPETFTFESTSSQKQQELFNRFNLVRNILFGLGTVILFSGLYLANSWKKHFNRSIRVPGKSNINSTTILRVLIGWHERKSNNISE